MGNPIHNLAAAWASWNPRNPRGPARQHKTRFVYLFSSLWTENAPMRFSVGETGGSRRNNDGNKGYRRKGFR